MQVLLSLIFFVGFAAKLSDAFRYHVPVAIALAGFGVHLYTLRNIPPRPGDDHYIKLASSRFPSSSTTAEFPLKGQRAIITGSSGGLGKEIASELYSLGCDVILAARNRDKLEEAALDIRTNRPESEQIASIIIIQLDTSDLDAVSDFATKFESDYSSLDWLVNNAGIHYASGAVNQTYTSKQGFDMAFATNYLGHFLLTELLTPLLDRTGEKRGVNTRIVNIASTYHAQSDGSMLRNKPPYASRGDVNDFFHREAAYGNNKLAQILHAKEVMRRRKHSHVEMVSVCPGWVATEILPKNLIGSFVKKRAFSPKAGALAGMM